MLTQTPRAAIGARQVEPSPDRWAVSLSTPVNFTLQRRATQQW